MKKLYIVFVAYLALLTADLFIIQFDSTVASIIYFIFFISSMVLAITLGGIVLLIYFKPIYLIIKWPLICLIVTAIALTAYILSFMGRIEYLKELDTYVYIPILVAFILGSIFYVQIINILKREKTNFDATWTDILLGNEKVNALETDSVKNATSKLYHIALGIVFASIITETAIIVVVAALIGMIIGLKYFKKAALYLKTKAYIITEIIYFGSILLAAVLYYFTQHEGVVFFPIVGFIIFKVFYYKALKQRVRNGKEAGT